MSRKKARELVMIKLYQMEIHDEYRLDERFAQEAEALEDEAAYAIETVTAFLENKDAVDALITGSSENWDLKRISKVDLAILRTAITEMRYNPGIPESVSINEAVSLSQKFSDEDAYKFVNGILGKISRSGQ